MANGGAIKLPVLLFSILYSLFSILYSLLHYKGAGYIRLVSNPQLPKGGATVAQVSFSDSGGFGAVAASETRGIPVFAPRGISYLPCEGDRLLMLNVDGVETCVGCICVCSDLKSGEIKIASAGGATAHFKNNGEISLNGLIITKDGHILEGGGA